MGVIKARLRHRNKSLDELVYVIRNQGYSLLSRLRWCQLGRSCRQCPRKHERQTEFSRCIRVAFQRHRQAENRASHHAMCRRNTGQYTARKIAHPIFPQIKLEIGSMVQQEIISPVTVPTRWCSSMVPVQKANGTVRICVDLTHLNKSVQREIHPMSSVDESLAKLGNSRVFSKLDANSGFWQLPLDEESITPVTDLNHATWSILLQSTTIRDQFRSGDIPATNVPNS